MTRVVMAWRSRITTLVIEGRLMQAPQRGRLGAREEGRDTRERRRRTKTAMRGQCRGVAQYVAYQHTDINNSERKVKKIQACQAGNRHHAYEPVLVVSMSAERGNEGEGGWKQRVGMEGRQTGEGGVADDGKVGERLVCPEGDEEDDDEEERDHRAEGHAKLRRCTAPHPKSPCWRVEPRLSVFAKESAMRESDKAR